MEASTPDTRQPSWAYGKLSPETEVRLQSDVMSLHVVREDNTVVHLGSGFVVAARGKQAIALGAAHVFSHVEGRSSPRQRGYTYDHGAGRLYQAMRSGTLLAQCWPTRHEPLLCKVSAVHHYDQWDVAMYLVEIPADSGASFSTQFAVDTRVPSIGCEVFALGYGIGDEGPRVRLSATESGQEVRREVKARWGRITDVHLGGGGTCTRPRFQTSIPFDPGMSGGPVLLWDASKRSDMTVCGVVSSSLDVGAAQDCFVEEVSMAVPLLAYLPLAMSATRASDGASSVSLLDLIQRGIVKDHGNAPEHWAASCVDGNVSVTKRKDLLG